MGATNASARCRLAASATLVLALLVNNRVDGRPQQQQQQQTTSEDARCLVLSRFLDNKRAGGSDFGSASSLSPAPRSRGAESSEYRAVLLLKFEIRSPFETRKEAFDSRRVKVQCASYRALPSLPFALPECRIYVITISTLLGKTIFLNVEKKSFP